MPKRYRTNQRAMFFEQNLRALSKHYQIGLAELRQLLHDMPSKAAAEWLENRKASLEKSDGRKTD